MSSIMTYLQNLTRLSILLLTTAQLKQTLQLHTTSSSEPRTDKDMQCIKENLVLVTQVTVHDNLVDNELEC